jgi:hypothetical protein
VCPSASGFPCSRSTVDPTCSAAICPTHPSSLSSQPLIPVFSSHHPCLLNPSSLSSQSLIPVFSSHHPCLHNPSSLSFQAIIPVFSTPHPCLLNPSPLSSQPIIPVLQAEARKQDNGAGSQGHGGGAGGEGRAKREGGGVGAGSRTHLEHPIFSSALRVSSSGSKSQGPNSGGLSLPLHLVHREVSNEPRVVEKAPCGIESEEAAVLLEARERALELGRKQGSQERGVDASPRQGIAQEIASPGRMASPRVLAHKVSKSQLASS